MTRASRTLHVEFGHTVRRLRKFANLTLEDLAVRCGVTPNYIGSIENGHRDPSLTTIEALARGLGVARGELFGIPVKLGPRALEMAKLFDAASPGIRSGLSALLRTTGARRPPTPPETEEPPRPPPRQPPPSRSKRSGKS